MHRMRDQERIVHHLGFSPMKGILCVLEYLFVFIFDSLRNDRSFVATELIGR